MTDLRKAHPSTGSIPPAKFEYRRQEFGDPRADHRKVICTVTNRVGNVRHLVRGHVMTKCCKVIDTSRVVLGGELGCFAQREGSVQPVWGKLKHGVAMRPRHGENQIGACGNSWRELSRGELGCVAAELLENDCGIGVNRVPDHRVGPGTGCLEVRKPQPQPSTVRSGKPLRRGRPADVSRADEQDVQSGLLEYPSERWVQLTGTSKMGRGSFAPGPSKCHHSPE